MGELYKFALEEEIDHGRSVVGRFAAYKAEDAHFFCDSIKHVLKELRAEAGIGEEEEDQADDGDEEAAAPAHTNNRGAHKAWGGLDG